MVIYRKDIFEAAFLSQPSPRKVRLIFPIEHTRIHPEIKRKTSPYEVSSTQHKSAHHPLFTATQPTSEHEIKNFRKFRVPPPGFCVNFFFIFKDLFFVAVNRG